jgi:rhodanese-related sulfurtransferase
MRKTYKDLVAAVAPEVKESFPWDIVDEQAAGADIMWLDIRCPHEYAEMHIPGSLNVPRGILEIACDYGYEETVPELVEARQRKVVVVCRSGNRSILAAYTMQQLGFEDVVSLKTGLRGWNDYEQPLEDGQGNPVPLEQADDYFIPKLTPEQEGPKPTQA